MSAELEQAKIENRDTYVGALITIVIAGVLLVLIIFVGMTAWLQTEINYVQQDRKINVVNTELDNLRTQQTANITQYRAVNRQEGLYAIPIDNAMKIVVERNRKK
ncbi:hypothetical protein [Poriferisphaera sp. WC338]|uniref:hypothetical protein n=1 Tax=Poriferisphaera sp. WC338 TaxID=3425129 RepID=UPI003D817FE3